MCVDYHVLNSKTVQATYHDRKVVLDDKLKPVDHLYVYLPRLARVKLAQNGMAHSKYCRVHILCILLRFQPIKASPLKQLPEIN